MNRLSYASLRGDCSPAPEAGAGVVAVAPRNDGSRSKNHPNARHRDRAHAVPVHGYAHR
jgi:hypothetical protein